MCVYFFVYFLYCFSICMTFGASEKFCQIVQLGVKSEGVCQKISIRLPRIFSNLLVEETDVASTGGHGHLAGGIQMLIKLQNVCF